MAVQQQTYKKRIMVRFMSKKQLEKFQNDYNACKSANTNNLKSKAVSDLDKNYLKELISEVIKKEKKGFWER